MVIKFNISDEVNNYGIESQINSFLEAIVLETFDENDIIIEFFENEKDVTNAWKNNEYKKKTYNSVLNSLKNIVKKQKESSKTFSEGVDELFAEIDKNYT